jgi:hypothetical protein
VLGIRVPCRRSTINSFFGEIGGSLEVLSLKGVLKCSTKSPAARNQIFLLILSALNKLSLFAIWWLLSLSMLSWSI